MRRKKGYALDICDSLASKYARGGGSVAVIVSGRHMFDRTRVWGEGYTHTLDRVDNPPSDR